jgi:hypothetical protein
MDFSLVQDILLRLLDSMAGCCCKSTMPDTIFPDLHHAPLNGKLVSKRPIFGKTVASSAYGHAVRRDHAHCAVELSTTYQDEKQDVEECDNPGYIYRRIKVRDLFRT